MNASPNVTAPDWDVNALANARAKGKRPWFYESKEAERVLNIVMALAQELAVTRERLDTLERLMQAKALLSQAEMDSYVPNKRAAAERGDANQAYLARILRILSQELEAQTDSESQSGAGNAVTVEELAKK